MSDETWLRGDWMQTYTGRRFWPMDPRPEDVHPEDIAHALSLLCRYNGHVRRFYSVAEHCVLMSEAVSPENKLWALLHDATEAYVGDMIRPLKNHMPAYRDVEDKVMEAIGARFGLGTWLMPAEVKDADNRIVLNERAALLSPPAEPWAANSLEPLDVQIGGFMPAAVERMYLNALRELA